MNVSVRIRRWMRVLSLEAIFIGFATITVVLVMVVHLVFLTRYPKVFVDEPWIANAAWNWLKSGINFDTMHAGTLDQFGYEWIRRPYIGQMPLLATFSVFGLSLFSARLASWVFGALLIVLTFVVGKRSYGTATGILASLFLSLSPPFLQASHYARPDIMLSAVVMLAYLLVLIALETDRWWIHLLAGLVIGLSVDIHQNGILFAPGLAALYLINYRSQVQRTPGTWLFVTGTAFGMVVYATLHILPSPVTYSALFSFHFGGSHMLPLQMLNPSYLLRSAVAEIGRYHFYENGLDFAVVGASVAYLLIRHRIPDRRLLVFSGVSFVIFVLFVGNKNDVYAILFYPCFMLMVAETVISLTRSSRGYPSQQAFLVVLVALFLINSTIHLMRPIVRDRTYDYYAITERIKDVLPEGARVMGLPHWWLGLADYDYLSSLNLTFYHFYNGYTLSEALESDQPDYFVVDSAFRGLLVDSNKLSPGKGFDIFKLPLKEFDDFLAQRGKKVLEFSNPWHGNFEVYRIDWSNSP